MRIATTLHLLLAAVAIAVAPSRAAEEAPAVPDATAIEVTTTAADFSFHILIAADGGVVIDYRYGKDCCPFAGMVHGEGRLTDAALRALREEITRQRFAELPRDISLGKGARKASDNIIEVIESGQHHRVHLIDRRTGEGPSAGPTREETRFFGVLEAITSGCPAFPHTPVA